MRSTVSHHPAGERGLARIVLRSWQRTHLSSSTSRPASIASAVASPASLTSAGSPADGSSVATRAQLSVDVTSPPGAAAASDRSCSTNGSDRPSSSTVHSMIAVPRYGIHSSKWRKNRMIEILMISRKPIVKPSTMCSVVRAGNSTWYCQSRGTICHISTT